MFDYKLLQALDAVVQEQSFERAAAILSITQSAISQRIKQLEEQVAQPLLVRSHPVEPTVMGQKLLGHFRQVKQLEQELRQELFPTEPNQRLNITIAVNADSLATWFIPAINLLLTNHPIELNLLISHESHTLEKIKNGEAFAAISSNNQVLPGCKADKLGDMEYVLTAAPSFKKNYFGKAVTAEKLLYAPAVAFDQKDDMHAIFLAQHFNLLPGTYPCHTVRSSEAFVSLAKEGAAYCLIPRIQVQTELNEGSLIELSSKYKLKVPLYWHRWILEKGIHKLISESVIKYAKNNLF
ncbi:LysR family transcriptional regulator ArgP [Endozoicomonas sp. SM1973]|uniref:LysR family transcriptional regulator ArgP n=1 Tax=Spartinivicinus marinus TaxID=2994442 RepID=A0A853IGS4_9GAMM|nr:LysR family transcriptional regulator ArgP [Spartinivicinus marinus]MCX4027365.1 LysR family transcriptional regulator ArgP [Spartinivicinus marinus]NYZ69214.1 LysR family transcriptional regulator ArgP [Spartinivicinus marinus]